MNAQIKTVGICVIVAGLIFTVLGLNAKKKADHLRDQGVSSPGMITSSRVELGSKGKKRHILTVKWGGEAAPQTESFQVRKKYFETKVDGNDQLVATDVVIRYIPGQPGTAIIEGGTIDYSGMQWLGYMTLFGGIITSYKAFKPRSRPPASA